MANQKRGPKSELNEELLGEIKDLILEGKDLKTIAKTLGILTDTFYQWKCKNYQGLNDKIDGWKRDRKLMKAEENIQELLEMNTSNVRMTDSGHEVEFKDSGLVRVKADMSKFVAETLGKNKGYAKRSELTGAEGEALIPVDPAAKEKSKQTLKSFLDAFVHPKHS